MPPYSKDQVVLLVSMLVKKESAPAVLDYVRAAVVKTRKEPGCLAMNVFQRADEDGRIFILEVWASPSLHAEHRKLPSGDEFRAFVAPHVIEPPSASVLKLAD